jgi:hypothetical protein
VIKLTPEKERLISFVSAGVLIFGLGAVFGALDTPANKIVAKVNELSGDFKRNGLAYLGVKPTGHLEPLRFAPNAHLRIDTARMAPGVTFVTGLFGDKLGARLYADDGSLLHEWPVDFFKLYPDRMKYKFGALIHGDYLYPNGDILMVVDSIGMARVSACGEIVWKNGMRPHHAIDIDEDGYIWTPKSSRGYDEPRLMSGRFSFDRVAKFDPKTGDQLELIDLVEILTDAGLEGIAQSNSPRAYDVMHLNDVEILKNSMAAAFPMFKAGDIMLSSRNLNQIWVIDGKSHDLKWWRTGPMHGQHDPDFQPDGTITMLDNRAGAPPSKKNGFFGDRGGSRIIAIDPASYGYKTLYASDDRNKFYTPYRGKHQILANGDILITETDAGRVFEVTPQGDVVWELINPYDEKSAGWVMSATRYPESYANIGKTCPKPAPAN